MALKTLFNRSLIRQRVFVQARQYSQYEEDECKIDMDCMPLPKGDWKHNYNKKNAKYNAILGIGVVSFIGMVFLSIQIGSLVLNYSPPPSYEA